MSQCFWRTVRYFGGFLTSSVVPRDLPPASFVSNRKLEKHLDSTRSRMVSLPGRPRVTLTFDLLTPEVNHCVPFAPWIAIYANSH